MLGGGDKGASGAIALTPAVDALCEAVAREYPKKYPALADKFAVKFAVHACQTVDGIVELPGLR
jgi:hypothetical protein